MNPSVLDTGAFHMLLEAEQLECMCFIHVLRPPNLQHPFALI